MLVVWGFRGWAVERQMLGRERAGSYGHGAAISCHLPLQDETAPRLSRTISSHTQVPKIPRSSPSRWAATFTSVGGTRTTEINFPLFPRGLAGARDLM